MEPKNAAALSLALVVAICLRSGWWAFAAQTRSATTVAFVHGTVIDATGAPPRANTTVVISGERIVSVGGFDTVAVPPGARVIDATGRFLIPGLWDAHVHTRFEGIDHLRLLLVNGITSARNMSGPSEHLRQIQSWREQIRKGERVGPRVLTSGPILDGPGTNRSVQLEINNEEEGREAVRQQQREGVDFVKVYNLLRRETYLAIGAEAKQQGLPFAGHVPWSIKASEASATGQQTLEHLDGILLESSTQEEGLRQGITQWQDQRGQFPLSAKVLAESFSAEKARALAQRLRTNRTIVVPTLSVCGNFEGASAVETSRLRYLPAAYVDSWKQVRRFDPVEDARQRFTRCQSAVQVLNDAGVTMLAGTDGIMQFQIDGFSLQDELALLVKSGLSEMQALQAATRNPARAFNLPDLGTIESGKVADLVLLDANPLEKIENSKRIAAVVAAGRLFDRSALDAILADIQRSAAEWRGAATR